MTEHDRAEVFANVERLPELLETLRATVAELAAREHPPTPEELAALLEVDALLTVSAAHLADTTHGVRRGLLCGYMTEKRAAEIAYALARVEWLLARVRGYEPELLERRREREHAPPLATRAARCSRSPHGPPVSAGYPTALAGVIQSLGETPPP